jgi:hypothetical protein
VRYTLLELTQRILESMGSDEVNNIADTTESLAVANIIKECYYDIIGEIQPGEVESLFHLDASGDNLKPAMMYLPTSVVDIQVLKYNVGASVTDTNFRELCFLPIDEFLDHMNGLDVNETWVASQEVTVNGQNFNIKYRNDESPNYYTTVDDRVLLFDSYDSSYETTLTASRTYGVGTVVPTFTMSNTYVPDLDPRHFQLLLNAAKAQAFAEIKQTSNDKAERKERRNRALAYKSKDSTDVRTAKNKTKQKGYGR